MNILEISNLNKTYTNRKGKSKIALTNINFAVEKGDFFALLGPNGAGKSTLINILAGLVNKTSGEVKIAGLDLDQAFLPSRYKIGIVPQELTLDPFFTVYETLEIYAGYYGIPKSKRITNELITRLGLADKINSKPAGLSGGMKRRLLIAKALVHMPDIIILDEPTAGVDIELRQQLWNYMKELNAQGKTIIITTHYLEEAQKLCNKVAIINNGQLIYLDYMNNIANQFSTKSIEIKFSNNIQSLAPTLQAYLDLSNHSLKFDLATHSPAEVINLLNQFNINITDIKTQVLSLEDFFVKIIHSSPN
ncbi:ABC transporter ATP-binding protein [Rickettsiales endosymbiont of Stachyamoeba lipophora]|uniref:ABC transporter ATP-binding protein n=1 Tax=Rickettsiales endosymbiont of Stachyamoeba lipophora TaxID=2486578 RepID=UPI000F646D1B|nr:ABC transporter ATP-binding protein [Rickettsiales endosymbiont of Stachyamoeba lipophora]AZL15180.1 ABC transporter ATP-binding protein [Rickettsiales endosymbiont of Stachyamoeba lipophora]